ncbi:MAG: MFS transporter [Burkholderiaceae bacterium]
MPSSPHTPIPPPNGFRWLILAGVWLIYAGFGLVVTSLAPLVAPIQTELGLSHSAMGSVLGAWQLIYIVSAVPCGLLLDRLGVRAALTLAAVIIAASAFGRAMAFDYWSLLFAVMVFGLGGPIVSAGAPKVIAHWFTGADRGFAMGVYLTGPSIGGVISLTLTHSVLLPAFGGQWRSVLISWAGVALLAGASWWFLAGTRRARANSPDAGPDTPTPQRQTIRQLLASPAVRLVMLMSVGVFMFNHGLNNWLPELLRRDGMTAINAGYWASIPTIVGILGSLTIPRLAIPGRRFRILMILSIAALIASLLLHFQAPVPLFTGLMMQGVARSALMTVLILTLVELPDIGPSRAGTAAGLFFSAAEIGGVMGPLGLGALYDLTGSFDAGLFLLSAVSVLLIVGVSRLERAARG